MKTEHLMRNSEEVDLLLTDKTMKNLFISIGTLSILIGTLNSCNQNNPKQEVSNVTTKSDSLAKGKVESTESFVILADTITYDVNVYNVNPEDPYTERFLKNVKPEILINSMFDAVYSGKLKAYDIFTNKELPISRIKEIEKTKGFSRSKIGKIQFTESWQMNPGSLEIQKKVIAMAFGYAHSDNPEDAISYDKPLFRVYVK